jgi:hypothetical protein
LLSDRLPGLGLRRQNMLFLCTSLDGPGTGSADPTDRRFRRRRTQFDDEAGRDHPTSSKPPLAVDQDLPPSEKFLPKLRPDGIPRFLERRARDTAVFDRKTVIAYSAPLDGDFEIPHLQVEHLRGRQQIQPGGRAPGFHHLHVYTQVPFPRTRHRSRLHLPRAERDPDRARDPRDIDIIDSLRVRMRGIGHSIHSLI